MSQLVAELHKDKLNTEFDNLFDENYILDFKSKTLVVFDELSVHQAQDIDFNSAYTKRNPLELNLLFKIGYKKLEKQGHLQNTLKMLMEKTCQLKGEDAFINWLLHFKRQPKEILLHFTMLYSFEYVVATADFRELELELRCYNILFLHELRQYAPEYAKPNRKELKHDR